MQAGIFFCIIQLSKQHTQKGLTMKQALIDLYLDWTNNYLTHTKIAEHYGVDTDDILTLIDLGRKYHEQNVALQKSILRIKSNVYTTKIEA